MTSTSLLEASAGLLLVFFLPGYTTTRAVFPEWRLRGVDAWRRGVEIVTLSFVLSIGWAVVVGYLLLAGAPGGFQASWTNPELEVALLAIALVTFLVGWRAHAYARNPPATVASPTEPGEEGAWELTRHLDHLAREERRLEHALRVTGSSGAESEALRAQLSGLREESSRLRQNREQQYAR
jgi:uncharacterized protein DUF1616